jgi:hypothetical protein
MPCSVKGAGPDALIASGLPPVDIGVKILALKLTWESKASLLKERHDISPTGFVSLKCPQLRGRGVFSIQEWLHPIAPGLSL